MNDLSRGHAHWVLALVLWPVLSFESSRGSQEKLLAHDSDAEDHFGRAVSISGDVALVGASEDDEIAPDSGAAYIFRLENGSWTEEQKLVASDGEQNDQFGRSVALLGDLAVVGAWKADGPGQVDYDFGAVYVFRFSGSSWTQEAILTASDGARIDHFGHSVAVGDAVVVVGALFRNERDEHDVGAAYVYRFDGVEWAEEQKLLASDGSGGDPEGNPGDQFGFSVATSSDIIVVGARWDDEACQEDIKCDSGSAYVFRFDGSHWHEYQKLQGSNRARGDEFGYSVAIDHSADLIVVGAPFMDGLAVDTGSAFVFRRPGKDACWVEEAVLVADDAMVGDQLGTSVAVDAEQILLGSPTNDSNGEDSGAAYVYRFSQGLWTPTQKLTPIDGAPFELFGSSVDMATPLGVVGAVLDDDGAGSACVFDLRFELESIHPQRTRYDRPTQVVLTGSGFFDGAAADVFFGSTPATNVSVLDGTSISCDTPVVEPGQDGLDVRLTIDGYSATLVDAFSFTPSLKLSGNWSPGGELTLTYLLDPQDHIFAVYGLSPTKSIDTPPFDGKLCIWPLYRFFITQYWLLDKWEQTFNIPDNPNLSGLQVLFQGLIGPSFRNPKDAAWTNCGVVDIK